MGAAGAAVVAAIVVAADAVVAAAVVATDAAVVAATVVVMGTSVVVVLATIKKRNHHHEQNNSTKIYNLKNILTIVTTSPHIQSSWLISSTCYFSNDIFDHFPITIFYTFIHWHTINRIVCTFLLSTI